MEIHNECQFSNTLFQPVENCPKASLLTFKPYLQDVFAAEENANEGLLLQLNQELLVIHSENRQFSGYVQIHFDLKFEVIYEEERVIKSPKRGLKLIIDAARWVILYAKSEVQIATWAKALGKLLNQVGFHQNFRPLKKLGKGNFASVYEVERAADGRRFAVKAFSKANSFSAKNGRQGLINELRVMRTLSSEPHKNVLRLQGVFESENSIYVVLELLNGNQLYTRIQQTEGRFTAQQVQQFLRGLLSGLHHLHRHRIMHRDLKPENIMLRSNISLEPVIVDFGLATHCEDPSYLFFRCGTPGYVAPEIIALTQSEHIEPECDVFSVGAIFHVLLTRKSLFEGVKYEDVYRKNKEMNIDLTLPQYSKISPAALNLLSQMLQVDPKKRITAEKALQHEYFLGSIVTVTSKLQARSQNIEGEANDSQKKKSKKRFFLF